MNIDLQDIIAHCGDYKQNGQHYYFQCPYCNDSGKDNMIFTPSKGLLKCFADESHSRELLKAIHKNSDEPKQIKPQATATSTKQWELNEKEYTEYMIECNTALVANNKALTYLYDKRLINPFTVMNCGLGYDFEENKWVIPVRKLGADRLYGFEYRPADFGVFAFNGAKCIKEKDTPSCLATVWGLDKAKKLYIVEGFMDGYILAQWLGYPDDVTIITPTMGVGTLPSLMTDIVFSDFDEIILCLDNDEAGRKIANQLVSEYDFLVDRVPKKKDIGDDYYEYCKSKGQIA